MDEKLQKKQLRKGMNPTGLTMLAYYGIMNITVIIAMLLDLIVYLATHLNTWSMDGMMQRIMEFATSNGWGYLLAMVIGGAIALLWKKIPFWKDGVFAKEKPMTFGTFFQLLFVFISVQAVTQFAMPLVEWFLNQFHLSAMAAMEAASISTTGFSMFLYVTILGPVTEELLFRGLALRMLQPYGKRFAVFASALLFGLFHGNVVQIPFAFLVGLVLGYITVEYSIVWAIVLHIFNNLVLSELFGRLVMALPENVGNILFYGVLLEAFAVAILILILRRKDVKAYYQNNRMNPLILKAFITTPSVLIFGIMMLLTSLMTFTII